MIVLSICLSDIPKELITAAKNKKSYINLVVDKRKEADKFGNTHSVSISQSKEDRESKTPKVYVGNAKEYIFSNNNDNHQTQPLPTPTTDDGDDLPF